MRKERKRMRQAISITLDASHIAWCEACIREKRFPSYSAAIDYCIRREIERQKTEKDGMSVEDRLLRLEQAVLFPRRDAALYPISPRRREQPATRADRVAESAANQTPPAFSP